jgi:GTP cyclohydrolase IB
MPFFVNKHAPVSGVASLLDYDLLLDGRIEDGAVSIRLEVVVPVTSLCPCSKEISEYGAHNQRSHVTVRALLADHSLCVRDLIDRVEAQASSELFGLLKRPDEKLVTERAYDNPKFVEDMVRDVARSLCQETRIRSFEVSAENFESIHNHSAYALVRGEPGKGSSTD